MEQRKEYGLQTVNGGMVKLITELLKVVTAAERSGQLLIGARRGFL
jgi:hypothetical protein